MNEKILAIIAGVTKKKVAEIEQNMDTEGLWDSFSRLELVINLEAEFGITFEQEEIASLSTPQNVIAVVQARCER